MDVVYVVVCRLLGIYRVFSFGRPLLLTTVIQKNPLRLEKLCTIVRVTDDV